MNRYILQLTVRALGGALLVLAVLSDVTLAKSEALPRPSEASGEGGAKPEAGSTGGMIGYRGDGSCVCEIFDLGGRKIGSLPLPVAAAEGERRDRIIEATGGPGWEFSYGCPFTVAGDRMYVRANSELLCLGAAK